MAPIPSTATDLAALALYRRAHALALECNCVTAAALALVQSLATAPPRADVGAAAVVPIASSSPPAAPSPPCAVATRTTSQKPARRSGSQARQHQPDAPAKPADVHREMFGDRNAYVNKLLQEAARR